MRFCDQDAWWTVYANFAYYRLAPSYGEVNDAMGLLTLKANASAPAMYPSLIDEATTTV